MSSESGADVRTESPTAIAPETAAPCGFDCVVSREAAWTVLAPGFATSNRRKTDPQIMAVFPPVRFSSSSAPSAAVIRIE